MSSLGRRLDLLSILVWSECHPLHWWKVEEREAAKTTGVCFRQLYAILHNISDWSKVVLAYESVWAIGTGTTATWLTWNGWLRMWTLRYVEVGRELFVIFVLSTCWKKTYPKCVSDVFLCPAQVAGAVRILYGGSVTTANCKELAAWPDIDGYMVVGASLKKDYHNWNINFVSRFLCYGERKFYFYNCIKVGSKLKSQHSTFGIKFLFTAVLNHFAGVSNILYIYKDLYNGLNHTIYLKNRYRDIEIYYWNFKKHQNSFYVSFVCFDTTLAW